MAKVSIIVPVYNCEEYLKRCVDSILAQTEHDLQLILVDDGSADGSGAICDAYAAKDPRVLVIHQKNAGVSAARNAGLDAANGAYIGFVDADDYIAEVTYETALSAIGSCDMAMWDAETVWDNGSTAADSIPLLAESRLSQRSDWTPELLAQMAGAVWRCLYKAELLRDVRFPVGIKLSEDRLFNIHAMGKANKLSYLKKPMYFRYVRKGSAVNRYHGDRFEKSILAMDLARGLLQTHWSEEYFGVYTRMFLIEGALSAVCEICCRDFSGKSRLRAIGEIVDDEALIAAFRLCPAQRRRETLLYKRRKFLLLLFGTLFNIKNR